MSEQQQDALEHAPSFEEMVGLIEKLFKDSLEMTKAFTAEEIESGWQRYKTLNHLYQDVPIRDSKWIIGRSSERFKELEHKEWDWRSFYNGWIEGRADMYEQEIINSKPLKQPKYYGPNSHCKACEDEANGVKHIQAQKHTCRKKGGIK